MTLRGFACALAAATLAAGSLVTGQVAPPPAAPQQTQPPSPPPLTFRVEVNYVEVDAVVTDAQGRLVSDLTADDFELLEDRKPQMISNFSLINIPIERADRPLFAAMPIEPDVQTNTIGEGRLYMIVLDSYHTAPANVIKVKAAARRFIERSLGTNDMAAVVFTGGNSRDTQDFTNNRRLLIQAVEHFTSLNTPGATVSKMQELQARIGRQPGDALTDPNEFERAFKARNAMDRIRKLAEFMTNVRGRRKAMLLIGEGVDYDFRDILGNNQATGVLESVRDAIGVATRANVAIYAIDPRGLTNPDSELIGFSSSPGADDPSLGNLGSRSIAQEFRVSQDSLRQLAEDTGGFAVLNQNDFSGAFDRIVRDNSSYYVLGYYPTNDRRDGRFRTITVRVRRPGLTVRARRGYVAPRGRAPAAPAAAANPIVAAVNDAISSPLPVPGIPMQVFAAPFKGEAPNANVAIAIEMDVKGFGFTEAEGTFNDRVEMAFVATDTEGKSVGNVRHAVTMTLRPDTMQRSRERGFRVLSQMNLPPGRYQLRVAAAESGASRAGSVITDLEVPDFYKAPFTMSGVALTSSSAAQTATAKPADPLALFLPGPATTIREFDSSDQIGLFAEFYENTRNAPPHKIDITTTVRTDDGRVVRQNDETRDSSELQGGSGGYGFTTILPLEGLSPGIYVIHVEARSRVNGPEAGVGRDVQIRIR
jgi:VWFA-related protein